MEVEVGQGAAVRQPPVIRCFRQRGACVVALAECGAVKE
jgi:hypothetical protein